MSREREYDLEDRVIDYAVRLIRVSEALPETMAGRHVADQILRSGTAPAPNYGEAQGAESRKDFVHKLRLSLKEPRETKIWLKIIQRGELIENPGRIDSLIAETEELLAIFYTSSRTARDNDQKS